MKNIKSSRINFFDNIAYKDLGLFFLLLCCSMMTSAASLKEELFSKKWVLNPQDRSCKKDGGSFITYDTNYGRVFTIKGKQGLPQKKPFIDLKELSYNEIVISVNIFGTDFVERKLNRGGVVAGYFQYKLVRDSSGKIKEIEIIKQLDLNSLNKGIARYIDEPEKSSMLEPCSAERDQIAAEAQASRQVTNSQTLRQVVRIGHIGPLSGVISNLGKENENGARMAIDEINATGLKIGDKAVKFELFAEDDGSDPKQAIAAAKRLVAAKVNGVIGHLNSGASIPASLVYNAARIPQISPSTTNPKYTRQGYSGAFRVIADDAHLGRTLGKFAVQNLKGKRIAVIDDRTAYGYGIAEEFKQGAVVAGGIIIAHEFTKDKASEFTTILTQLQVKKPDVVFFGGMDHVAGPLLRQMNSMGINAKFLGGDGICTNDLASLAREAMKDDTIFCAEAGGVQGAQKEGMEKFRTDFESKYNAEVQIYAPYVYDAVMVMAAAMVKAGSVEPEKYLPALKTIKYKGVTGVIEFDEKGDIKDGAITFYTYRNGERIKMGVIR
jgi:branched-chain amino acid transport system substrate-binding protein